MVKLIKCVLLNVHIFDFLFTHDVALIQDLDGIVPLVGDIDGRYNLNYRKRNELFVRMGTADVLGDGLSDPAPLGAQQKKECARTQASDRVPISVSPEVFRGPVLMSDQGVAATGKRPREEGRREPVIARSILGMSTTKHTRTPERRCGQCGWVGQNRPFLATNANNSESGSETTQTRVVWNIPGIRKQKQAKSQRPKRKRWICLQWSTIPHRGSAQACSPRGCACGRAQRLRGMRLYPAGWHCCLWRWRA